jgi:pilus assembly protein Flp/PilA
VKTLIPRRLRETIMTAKSFFIKLCRNKRAATAVEYGLILVMLVIAIISALKGVADENTGMWAIVSSKSAAAHSSVR